MLTASADYAPAFAEPVVELEVRAVGAWRNNADLFADVARLGYLDGEVLDVTYGEGAFWRAVRPATFLTSDRYKAADLGLDYRSMRWTTSRPLPADWCDVVVFDPPYKLSGTPALGEFDARYGIQHRTTRDEVLGDIVGGALECYRLARRFVLVKCQDQVEGGRVRWQTDIVTRALEDVGARKIDRFDLVVNGRPQPPGRTQRTARRNHSTLLVFEKARGKR